MKYFLKKSCVIILALLPAGAMLNINALKKDFRLKLEDIYDQVSDSEEEIYCSQFGQDQFVNETFFHGKRNGVFVDIGAHDGIMNSNTCFFEECLGWTGICIEPIPHLFEELKKNRDCFCFNGCIANFNGPAKFLQFSDNRSNLLEVFSGLVDTYDSREYHDLAKHLTRLNRGTTSVVDVQCYILEDVLKRYNIERIDYLSIDTEGAELTILKSIDFSAIDIDVISVENLYTDETGIQELLEKNGYTYICRVGLDEIYKKNPRI